MTVRVDSDPKLTAEVTTIRVAQAVLFLDEVTLRM
jgi:hypothetical protein